MVLAKLLSESKAHLIPGKIEVIFVIHTFPLFICSFLCRILYG